MEYRIVVLPKLDNQDELQLLRERHDPWFYQLQPYITIIPSLNPATLDQLEEITAYLSRVRRNQPPVVVRAYNCVERDDRLVCPIQQGREELIALHNRLSGAVPGSLLPDEDLFEPALVVARVPDPEQRLEALHEVNLLGRTIGLIDALSLVALEEAGRFRLVAGYPFGIGRVDYFDLSGGSE